MKHWNCALALLACIVGFSAVFAVQDSACAEDTWSDPWPGVRHLNRDAGYPYDNNPRYQADVLLVDLTHPAVHLRATPPDQRGGVVSDFAQRNGLEVAWNTNFYANTTTPCGMMMGNGQLWDNAYNECQSSLGVGDANQVAIFTTAAPTSSPPEPWMRHVVSGLPQPIVQDGSAVFSYGCGSNCSYNPRTGIGYDRERRTLIVVVVDGRSSTSVGAGLDDLGNLLVEFGAWEAINLDGGGSSTMYIEGQGVVNTPSGGSERNVCCHMGIDIDPNARWYGAVLEDQSPSPQGLRVGEQGELWASYRNVGRRTWFADGDNAVKLGTQDPQDRTSVLYTSAWPADNRSAFVGQAVEPGQTGRFTFPIASEQSGNWQEAFAPVAEGAAWMDDAPVSWEIQIEAASTSNGTTGTSNGTTSTSNGTTSTSNGTASTSNGTTSTSNGTTATSNGLQDAGMEQDSNNESADLTNSETVDTSEMEPMSDVRTANEGCAHVASNRAPASRLWWVLGCVAVFWMRRRACRRQR